MVDAAARSGQTQSVEPSGESGDSGTLKEAFRLALRCWPYYRAQAKHLGTFVLINTILGACVLGAGIIGSDLIENKIIMGEQLEPMQATMLLLDSEYVINADAAATTLSADQRKEVR